jgi:arylsulfatase A-like enzyme
MSAQNATDVVARTLTVAILAGLAYAGSEWLFFVTKPSALAEISIGHQLLVLWQTSAALGLIGIIVTAPASIAAAVTSRQLTRALCIAGMAWPAVAGTATLFLLVENFSYTLFRVSVLTVRTPVRVIYGVTLMALCVWLWWRLSRYIRSGPVGRPRRRAVLTIAALASAVTLAAAVLTPNAHRLDVTKPDRLPNIVFIGSDMMLANHISLYGYERNTTPFLKIWASDALVAENAFANGYATTASLGALLSGKHPIRTHVIRHPNAFRGEDAFQHFAGILRSAGYYLADFGVRTYGDPFDLGMKAAFHRGVDGRQESSYWTVTSLEHLGLLGQDASRFVQESLDRVRSRVACALGFGKATNPFDAVTRPGTIRQADEKRYREFLDFLRVAEEPFFVHVHLMSTHGPRFNSAVSQFSSGVPQNQSWMTDYYDDSILEFDRRFAEAARVLAMRRLLDRTLVAVYSDHGTHRNPQDRMPLAIRFPRAEYRGRLRQNTELLDLPATVLKYLNIPMPDWMDGQPLIPGLERDSREPLFVGLGAPEELPRRIASAPFYDLERVAAVYCQTVYTLNISSGQIQTAVADGHTAPCAEREIPTGDTARKVILRRLIDWDYPADAMHTTPLTGVE